MLDEIGIADALIRHCEGCRLSPYLDVHDLWSIAFGNRFLIDGSSVTQHTLAMTLDQAEQLLNATLLRTIEIIKPAIKITLRACEMGAVISLAYNIGPERFLNSTMLRYLNKGDVDLAWEQFPFWIKVDGRPVRGLVTRRALEMAVAQGRVDPGSFAPIKMPSPPHPLFTSTRTTTLNPEDMADALNAKELASLRPIPT